MMKGENRASSYEGEELKGDKETEEKREANIVVKERRKNTRKGKNRTRSGRREEERKG